MKFLIAIILLLSLLLTLNPVKVAGIDNATAQRFIKDLQRNAVNLEGWVLPEELILSQRLGIAYDNTPNKFLISYEILNASGPVQHTINLLEPDFTRLTIATTDQSQNYYFKGNKLVSPVYYFSRDWTLIESKYFVFVVSDPGRFNNYCMQKLDDFIEETSEILEISDDRMQQLQENKIYYFLCSSPNEIKNLTGYNTRGMYVLAYDYIVSTFNCHYHEIVHLLVNYKLQQLPLRTHPFFQEGIAVALGGRGGKEPGVILDMGLFLERSGFSGYRELLSFDAFTTTDASLSYPVSGVYNDFLLENAGVAEYLELYLKYSGDNYRDNIVTSDLPPHNEWAKYLHLYEPGWPINPAPGMDVACEIIYSDGFVQVCSSQKHTRFKVKRPVLLVDIHAADNYTSYLLTEHYPDDEYRGEKYLITSNNDEISVYNLYTNNLIAKYVTSMSGEQTPIDVVDGYRVFSIDNSVFENDVRNLTVRIIDPDLTGE